MRFLLSSRLLGQKIPIHDELGNKDCAQKLLYIHDTIEMFSEHLGELREYIRRTFGYDYTPRGWFNCEIVSVVTGVIQNAIMPFNP
jgi:hypothetical protein